MILKQQRGDTLIEVTIALVIMSTVLTSAFYIANRSIQVGRLAKQRNLLVTAAQTQAEALSIARDQLGWNPFLAKVNLFGGNCFHIDRTSGFTWASGALSTPNVPTGQVCVKATTFVSPAPANATMLKFNINYTAQQPLGPDIDTTLITQLGNVDSLRQVVAP